MSSNDATRRRRRNQPGEPVDDLHYYLRRQPRRTVHEMAAHDSTAEAIARLRNTLAYRALDWTDRGAEAMLAGDHDRARAEFTAANEQLHEIVGMLPEQPAPPLTLAG